MYKYIEELSTPKKWFKANVDEILRVYGGSHSITKEDLCLGTRSRPHLGLRRLRPRSDRNAECARLCVVRQ